MKIEEIKKELSILTVLGYYGLEMNKNKHLCCPFHDDKTPSMRVYEETNTVYCFSGNCKTHSGSLDVIGFVQEKEGCSKHEAILKCKELLGYKGKAVESTKVVVWRALKKRMVNTKKAKDYLNARGLSHQGVGYNSGLWQKGKVQSAAQLEGLDKWGKDCVIYGLKNSLGNVVSFYGRSLSKGETFPTKLGKHYYQNGRAGLYPSYPSKGAKRIILTESIIDAHTLGGLEGLKSYEVLALYGTWTGTQK